MRASSGSGAPGGPGRRIPRSPLSRKPSRRYTARAPGLASATHRATRSAPRARARSQTAATSCPAIPCPRCSGLTHIATRCQVPGVACSIAGACGPVSGKAATIPASRAAAQAPKYAVVARRRRHSGSSKACSRSRVEAKASGAWASASRRTSRSAAQSSGSRRRISAAGRAAASAVMTRRSRTGAAQRNPAGAGPGDGQQRAGGPRCPGPAAVTIARGASGTGRGPRRPGERRRADG
jgi:hypothetical protein